MRQVTLQVACIASFLAAPPVQLGYSVQGQVLNQTLSLPLSVGKFCTPPGAPVPREAFFSRWRAIAGALGGLGCLRGMCTLLVTSVPMGGAAGNAARRPACSMAEFHACACQGMQCTCAHWSYGSQELPRSQAKGCYRSWPLRVVLMKLRCHDV